MEYKARLQHHYEDHVVDRLREEFGFENPYEIPRVEKVVINVGIGAASQDPKLLDSVVDEVTRIAGQKPIVTRARKSISNFNIREGVPVGVKVTLRRTRMWEFLDRLINVALPRVRDFRGVPTRSFDGRGNYTLGIKEQAIFPEIEYDSVYRVHGMDVVIVTTTDKDDEAYALLRELGMPFRGETPLVVDAEPVGASA